MPTGYTDAISKGIDFPQFTMRCARAFGALVMMRDEPTGAKIPIFRPSTYSRDQLKATKKQFDRIKKMRVGTALEVAAKKAEEDLRVGHEQYEKTVAERDGLKAKYEDMLNHVHAWEPPTPDHEELKKFMVQQIEESIKFDCSLDYITDPELKTPEETFYLQLKQLTRDTDYHSKQWAEEQERTRHRNLWVNALVKSLRVTKKQAGVETKPKRKLNSKRKPAKKRV